MTAVTTDTAAGPQGYTWEGGPPAQPKPGFLTTEWWTTMVYNAVAAVLAFVALFSRQAANTGGHLVAEWKPFIGLAAVLAGGIATAVYSRSRGNVKSSHADALALWSVMSQLAEQGVLNPAAPAAVQVLLGQGTTGAVVPAPYVGPGAPPAPSGAADPQPPPGSVLAPQSDPTEAGQGG